MIKLWLLFTLFFGVCSGSRILVFYPGPSGSLLRSFNSLFHELSRRGHEVTVVTAHGLPGNQENNITQVILGHAFDKNVIKKMSSLPILPKVKFYLDFALSDCDNMFKNRNVKMFLNSNQTYDLFIGSPFHFIECSVAIAHHFNLPILNIFPNRMPIHFSYQGGHMHHYSYVADFFLPFSNNMNFWQRLTNSLFCLSYSLALSVYYIPKMNNIIQQHFPNLPPVQEMLAQDPVTLLNTNLAIHPSQPVLPGVIPVGSLTIPQSTKLPQELQKLMDFTDQGVILFSMGSNINTTSLDPMVLHVLLSVFSRLPHTVIMKWEEDHLDRKPDNVHIAKWIPQAAVLAHPHCQLIITHGGLHSWMEAVHYSVPLLGILPSFLDQEHNMAEMEERGHGLYFNRPWTEDNFLTVISEVLYNTKYKNNVQEASKVFWDQPMNPLQTAVYWTEYVIRHKGAYHLQSATSTKPWHQIVLLDIIAVLLFSVIVAVLLLCVFLRFLKHCMIDYEYIIFNCMLRILNKLKLPN